MEIAALKSKPGEATEGKSSFETEATEEIEAYSKKPRVYNRSDLDG